MAQEIRYTDGLPPVSAFGAAFGSPIVIDTQTSLAYYLAAGNVVTRLGADTTAIGGLPVILDDPQADDMLLFSGTDWTNTPKTNITDGGNF